MTHNMESAQLRKHLAVLLGFILVSHIVRGQNPIFGTPSPGGSSSDNNNVFYFDSRSDCNAGVRNLFGATATIIGSNQSAHSNGVTTCTIVLKSEGTFDGTILQIEVIAMNILDCSTQVSIYDGDSTNMVLLNSYNCRSSQNANRREFVTSKNVATFIMSRPTPTSYNFDVQIKINPVSSGLIVPTSSLGLVDFTKFPQEGIVGMISGFYVFIMILCVVIVVYMNRTYKGANKKWEINELANVKTGIKFDSKSQLEKPNQIATLEGMRNRELGSQYSRSTARPPLRSTAPPSEDGDSGVYYNEDSFQKTQLMKKERETVKNRFMANTAFIDQDDKPDNFRENIIIPSKHRGRNGRPPSYEEAVSDHTPENSSDEESSNASRRRRASSSDEERSERSSHRSSVSSRSSRRSRSTARTRSTRSPTPSESESEEESESDGSSSGHQARARKGKHRHKKQPEPKKSQRPVRPQPKQQQPPPPQMQQPYIHPPMYGAYPPGQYVPVMAGPPQFPPGFGPPQYQIQPQGAMAPPEEPLVQPTDIPVYSYLVQRGYKPLDTLNTSHASTDSRGSRGHKLEEPEIRLDSGVEYMRR